MVWVLFFFGNLERKKEWVIAQGGWVGGWVGLLVLFVIVCSVAQY